ncbi:MAG: peptidylprolyl isomerase [Pedobacter sp.]
MLIRSEKIQVFERLLISAIFLVLLASIAVAADNPIANKKVVARINGVAIFDEELAPLVEKRFLGYRRLGANNNLDQLKRRLQHEELGTLINQELLVQAGAALKLNDLEQRIEKRLHVSAINSKNKIIPEKKLDDQLRMKIRRDVLIDAYMDQKGISTIQIPEQELRLFYEKNPKNFVEPQTIKVRHILVKIPRQATPEKEREADNKAKLILEELKKGRDFAEAAHQYSDCTSKEKGGNLGSITPGFMPKEFDAVAFSLKVGEISGIVKTRHGLHIIRVDEKHPERMKEFPEVKTFIAGYLQKDYQRKKIDELVKELGKTATVEILLDK